MRPPVAASLYSGLQQTLVEAAWLEEQCEQDKATSGPKITDLQKDCQLAQHEIEAVEVCSDAYLTPDLEA